MYKVGINTSNGAQCPTIEFENESIANITFKSSFEKSQDKAEEMVKKLNMHDELVSCLSHICKSIVIENAMKKHGHWEYAQKLLQQAEQK